MKLKTLTLVIGFAIGLVLSSCSSDSTIIINPSPRLSTHFPFSLIWTQPLSSNSKIYSTLSPVIQNDIIYAAGSGGTVKSISLNTGKAQWSKKLSIKSGKGMISGGVGIDNKQIYLGSQSGVLYALDVSDGSTKWKQNIAGEILSIPVSSGDKVVIYTANGLLQVRNAETGDLDWQVSTDTKMLSLREKPTPLVTGNMVIIGDSNGHVDAYSLDEGNQMFQKRISEPTGTTELARLIDISMTPVSEDGAIYVGGYNGPFTAFNINDGRNIWRSDVGAARNVATNDQFIYVVDKESQIYALNKSDGAIVWHQSDLLNRNVTAPVIIDNYLAVGDFEGYLYLLDLNTGDFVSKTMVSSSGLLSQPIVYENNIIIQARNGNVYAYSSKQP